jgi:HK97 family phage prohead protease
LSQDLGNFKEKLDPHCFDKALASPDLRCLCLFNHDTNQPPLGSTTSGTLRLSADNVGLRYECDAPDTSLAKDLIVSMERGDTNQASFGFQCIEDSWDQLSDGTIVRTVLEAALLDVSPVNYGAYTQATSGVRAALRSCPVGLRSKITVRDLDDSLDIEQSSDDEDDDCPEGQVYSEEDDECVPDDDRSMTYRRCAYRCSQHRSADAGWDQIAGFADDDDAVRCGARCGRCERCLAMHSNLDEDIPATMEDSSVRAAHRRLLALR